MITDYEDYLAKLLQKFRDSSINEPINAALAAELVTHLTIRGAFVREVFEVGFQEIMATTSTLFSEAESIRSLLGIDEVQPTNFLIEEIDKNLKMLHFNLPSKIPELLLKRILLFWLREEFESIHAQGHLGLSSILVELTSKIPTLLRESHISVLEKSLAPEPRIQNLVNLKWTVLKVPDANLILPDCVAISVSGSEKRWIPYLLESNADDLEQVLLPISSSQLLVGRRNFDETVTIDLFNRFAAACSAEFFVSSINTQEIASYASDISKESKQNILSIARAAIEKASKTQCSKKDSETINDITASNQDTQNKTHITFSVSFSDSFDREDSEKIASIISIVANEFAKQMPLNRIESIIFTNDYKGTFQNLDRGFIPAQPLESTENEDGFSVAMAPPVLRDGKIMSCIIASSWLGLALLNPDDEDSFQLALHVLGQMFARSAFLELVDVSIPDTLLKPMEDLWNGMLFKCVYDALNNYFCARATSSLCKNINDWYKNQVLTAFVSTKRNIPEARLSYRYNNELDSFLEIAINEIGGLLSHIASFIGHCDGLQLLLLDDEEQITNHLRELGLEKWIYVFQRDLDKLFQRQGKWISISEFTALNIHIERLLSRFSVFPWQMNNGETRIEIPLNIDMPELLKSTNAEPEL